MVTDTRQFLKAFGDVMERLGKGRPPSPSGLLEQWRDFVDACAEGYAEDVYEFLNDRYVRETIEAVLTTPEPQRFDQMTWVRDEVGETIGDTNGPWWKARLPRYVGDPQLAEQLEARFGVEVEVRE